VAEDRDVGEGNEVELVPIAEPWHVAVALLVVLVVISLVIALNALQPPDHALTAGQPTPTPAALCCNGPAP
jgi:hypothetical protein